MDNGIPVVIIAPCKAEASNKRGHHLLEIPGIYTDTDHALPPLTTLSASPPLQLPAPITEFEKPLPTLDDRCFFCGDGGALFWRSAITCAWGSDPERKLGMM